MTYPDEMESWPEDSVTANEAVPEKLLQRAIVSLADEVDVDVPDADVVAELQERLADLEADIAAVEGHIETLEANVTELSESVPEGLPGEEPAAEVAAEERADVTAIEEDVAAMHEEFDEKVSDVRDRVIQVLREAESKAGKDHSHPTLRSRIDEIDSSVTTVTDRLEALETQVDERTDSLTEVVESQDERVDDVEEKLTRVASALVRIQRRVDELETEQAKRESVDELTAVANRHDIIDADCGHCDRTVHLGLLSEPRCPHCESHFDAVEPKSGFFGSARLTVGDRPAITGERNVPNEPSDVLEE